MGKQNHEEDVTVKDGLNCNRPAKIYEHPAFGLIRKSVYTGSRAAFGSPLITDEFISITITRATHECTATSEYYNPSEEMGSVVLTKAQWADFISTSNSGIGTPCTLKHIREGDLIGVPEISDPRYNSKDYYEHVKGTAQKSTDRLKLLNKELIDEINGKASKVRLREIQRQISVEVQNLPSNLAYAVQIAEESMNEVADQIAISAKSKIEAYAYSQGLEQVDVGQLTQITYRSMGK